MFIGNSQYIFPSFVSLHTVGVEFVQKSSIHSKRDDMLPIALKLQANRLIVSVEFLADSHFGIAEMKNR